MIQCAYGSIHWESSLIAGNADICGELEDVRDRSEVTTISCPRNGKAVVEPRYAIDPSAVGLKGILMVNLSG